MAKAKTSARKNPAIPVGEFTLEYKAKYERAVANLKAAGKVEPTELEVLTEYDRLAGRITYQGDTVRLGSFWDFDRNMPKATPTPKIVKKKQVVEEEVEMDVPMTVKEEKPKKADK